MQVWIGRNGERLGPYADEDIRQGLREGTYRPDELGWHEGMTDWRPLGELFPDARPARDAIPPMPASPPPFLGVHDVAEPEYAGFWLRVGAWVIDYMILMVPFTVISLGMGLGPAMTSFLDQMQHDQAGAMVAYAAVIRPISVVLMIVGFLYYAAFESSKWQATPGKMAVGIRVTDVEGRRLSVGRAAGRNAVRLLNLLTFLVPMVFYVVSAFTQRKQGVHDLMASTYVLTGRVDSVPVPVERAGNPGNQGRFDA